MDQVTMVQALITLGVHPQSIENLRRIPFPQAVEGLKKLQEEVKPRYKKLAFELHPDRTGGDEAKTKLFSEVTAANKWLQDLKVQPPPPQPVMTARFIQVVHYPAAHPFGGTVNTANWTTSPGASTHYNAARVAFIRFG
jgi:hypothetical protein